MKNLPKFLFCENPIAEKSDGRQFILHSQKPVLLAEVFHCGSRGDYTEDQAMELKRQFNVYAALDYSPVEYIVIGDQWIEGNLTQDEIQSLPKLMRRMADWYEAYLRWEDNFDKDNNDDEEIF